MKICIWLFDIDTINFDDYGNLNLVIALYDIEFV